MVAYPGIAYPVVQKRGVYLEPEVQLLLLLTVYLLNGPFLKLMRRDHPGACRKGGKEEGQGAGGRCMVVGRGNLKVDPDELQVRLDGGSVQLSL